MTIPFTKDDALVSLMDIAGEAGAAAGQVEFLGDGDTHFQVVPFEDDEEHHTTQFVITITRVDT